MDAKDTKDAADADAPIPDLIESLKELKRLMDCPSAALIKQFMPELERIVEKKFREFRSELEQTTKRVIKENNTLKSLAQALNKKTKACKHKILKQATELEKQATELEAARVLHDYQGAELDQFYAAYQQTAELLKTLQRARAKQAAELKTLQRARAKQAAELKTLQRARAKQAAELKTERANHQNLKQQAAEALQSVTCIACLENRRDTIFRRCNHVACCAQCAETLTTCPICRAPIVEKAKCYF